MAEITSELAEKVLTTRLPEGNGARAATVGEYLSNLLGKVWTQQEGFSGKRPFGDSGWENELTEAIVGAGHAEEEQFAAYLVEQVIEWWGANINLAASSGRGVNDEYYEEGVDRGRKAAFETARKMLTNENQGFVATGDIINLAAWLRGSDHC